MTDEPDETRPDDQGDDQGDEVAEKPMAEFHSDPDADSDGVTFRELIEAERAAKDGVEPSERIRAAQERMRLSTRGFREALAKSSNGDGVSSLRNLTKGVDLEAMNRVSFTPPPMPKIDMTQSPAARTARAAEATADAMETTAAAIEKLVKGTEDTAVMGGKTLFWARWAVVVAVIAIVVAVVMGLIAA